jgi:hypothetical protein
MTGFASLEKDGHAGELGGTGIKLGDTKFQVGARPRPVERGYNLAPGQGPGRGQGRGWAAAAAAARIRALGPRERRGCGQLYGCRPRAAGGPARDPVLARFRMPRRHQPSSLPHPGTSSPPNPLPHPTPAPPPKVAPGDESVIRGKSKGGGCCIKRTNTALVIGVYDEPVTAGDCNVIVENLGDYLKSMEF